MEGTAATIDTMITTAIGAVGNVIEGIWEQITVNPLLALFIGFSVVGIGIGFFSRLKSA